MAEVVVKPVVSREAVGAPPLSGAEPVEAPSLASAWAVGLPVIGIAASVEVPSLVGLEAVGTPTVVLDRFIEVAGITSSEGLGAPSVANAGAQSIYLGSLSAPGGFGYAEVSGGVRSVTRGPVPPPLRPRRHPRHRGEVAPAEALAVMRQLDARGRQQAVGAMPQGTADGDLLMWLDGAWHLLPSDAADGAVLTLSGGRPCWV